MIDLLESHGAYLDAECVGDLGLAEKARQMLDVEAAASSAGNHSGLVCGDASGGSTSGTWSGQTADSADGTGAD